MFVIARPQWKTEVVATMPDGSVVTRHTEHEICYTNLFDEEMRIPADPEDEVAKRDYAWHREQQDAPNPNFGGLAYSNVRWESRTVTTTTTPWERTEQA
jgi:hypothetical protein